MVSAAGEVGQGEQGEESRGMKRDELLAGLYGILIVLAMLLWALR